MIIDQGQLIAIKDNFIIFRKKIEILTPIIDLRKSKIVKLAKSLGGLCWSSLVYIHTSYDGKYPPSSKDYANILRWETFEEARLLGSLVLRAVSEKLMELPKMKNYEIKS